MKNKSLTTLVKEAHSIAREKGWWVEPRSALEIHALIHTEISEATEAVRVGDEGAELIELADAVIRIMDYAGSRNWDLEGAIRLKMEKNKTRTFRHGGKLF